MQRESELCASLLRTRMADCRPLGRELVRLLQDVAKLPPFDLLWRDLVLRPQVRCRA